MNDATQIWALYEAASQPPQYQPTENDKKAAALKAATIAPTAPKAGPTQPTAAIPVQQAPNQAQPQQVDPLEIEFEKFHGTKFNPASATDRMKMQRLQNLQKAGTTLDAQSVYGPGINSKV